MNSDATIHILVVDDDAQVRALLKNRFEKEGFQVSEAKNGEEMHQRLDAMTISLITLDLTLGHEDGLALAREIRTKRNVPIIMISGKDEEVDRVVGLELGADDYITKPFSPREVVARVRAVLRRYDSSSQSAAPAAPSMAAAACLAFDGGILHPDRREFTSAAGEPVDLTTAEFNLLEMFLRRPQRVLTRDEIMNLIKGHDWSPFDRSVDAAVARLRKKIEPDADRPKYIKTVRGIGYVFAGTPRQS